VPIRPAFVRPLIPSTAKAPPKGEGWTHEVKLDGYRFQIVKDGDRVRLYSRSGAEYTEPVMVEAFAKLPAHSAVLDGELCLIGPDGRPRFYQLMKEMRTRRPDESVLVFFCFDLLQQDGVDLRGLPLSERKRDLTRLCRKARVPFLKQVETFPDGQVLFEYACSYGFEGIVSKRLASRYTSGPPTISSR
jgi:bifunctional non-homologous end joining protein LigD